jgi:hypothetical protein
MICKSKYQRQRPGMLQGIQSLTLIEAGEYHCKLNRQLSPEKVL